MKRRKKNDKPNPKEPWSRIEAEPESSFEHFQAYIEQDIPRRLQPVADLFGLDIQTIHRQSSRWRWRERTHAWDAHIWAAKLAEVKKAHEKVSKEQVEAFQLARRVATKRILKLAKEAEKDERKLKELCLGDAMKFLERSAKMERLIYGDATERVERKYAGQKAKELTVDFSQLNQEELDAVTRALPILEKAGIVVDDDAVEGDDDEE